MCNRATVMGNFQCQATLLISIIIGQGLTVLEMRAGEVFDIFSLPFFPLSGRRLNSYCATFPFFVDS